MRDHSYEQALRSQAPGLTQRLPLAPRKGSSWQLKLELPAGQRAKLKVLLRVWGIVTVRPWVHVPL